MKQRLLYIITLLSFSNLMTAQILYDENFDLLTIGDVNQDLTGTVPGQGGWYTEAVSGIYPPHPTPLNFQIDAEPQRGNVLSLTSIDIGNAGYVSLEQRDLEALWSKRDWGKNVLKFECDFFTGDTATPTPFYLPISVIALYSETTLLAGFSFANIDGLLLGGIDRGTMQETVPLNTNETDLFIPHNQWYRFVAYVDYNSAQIHFEIPALDISVTKIVFDLLQAPETMEEHPPSFLSFHTKNRMPGLHPFTIKLDNVKISAVKYSPVSAVDILASKFNLFPNPVSDVVTISNNESIDIKEVVVYNINGKIIKTQRFDYQNEVQLNMQQMPAGVYLLHIKTNQGETVKKVIKK